MQSTWMAPGWRGSTCTGIRTIGAIGGAAAATATATKPPTDGVHACWRTPFEAHYADWSPDHVTVVQLYPDFDPPSDAAAFAFRDLPQRNPLIHDGRHLLLVTHRSGSDVRVRTDRSWVETHDLCCWTGWATSSDQASAIM